MTESADLETASDFISAFTAFEDHKLFNSIFVQESVSSKFIELLQSKLKPCNKEADLDDKLRAALGWDVIGSRVLKVTRRMLRDGDNTKLVTLEDFRTTKEALALVKDESTSYSLWCDKLSVAFEYINALGAQQIWLNSSFGSSHPKIPFLTKDSKIICDEDVKRLVTDSTKNGALMEISANIQYQTTFQNGKFKTVVIPYGETFAN